MVDGGEWRSVAIILGFFHHDFLTITRIGKPLPSDARMFFIG